MLENKIGEKGKMLSHGIFFAGVDGWALRLLTKQREKDKEKKYKHGFFLYESRIEKYGCWKWKKEGMLVKKKVRQIEKKERKKERKKDK